MRTRSNVAAVVAVVSMLVAGCTSGGSGGGDTATGPDNAEEELVSDEDAPDAGDRVVTVAVEADIPSPDPALAASILDRWMLENLQTPLTDRDVDGSLKPAIAERWEISDDELEWTIHLRDDVLFHNGELLTAEDVKFTIDYFFGDEFTGQIAHFWEGVEEVSVVDDHTVKVDLESPNGLLMEFGARFMIYPKAYFEEVGPDGYAEAPIGTGPFKFVEWRPDDRFVLEAFEDYFEGPPGVDGVVFRPIPNESARTSALRSGEVDIATSVALDQVSVIEDDPELRTEVGLSLDRSFVAINSNVEPFDKLELRQALNHAVDTQAIIDALLEGEALALGGGIVPEEFGFNPDLEPYTYDPDLARDLMAAAGHPDGDGVPAVELSANGSFSRAEEIAQAVAAYLEEVGLDVSIRVYEGTEFRRLQEENNIGVLQYDNHGGGATFLSVNFFNSVMACEGHPSFSPWYCNPDVDALKDQAMEVWSSDPEQAEALLQQADQLIHDDAAYIWLFQTSRFYGVNDALEWEPHPSGTLNMHGASFS